MTTTRFWLTVSMTVVSVISSAESQAAGHIVGVTLGFAPGTAPFVRIDPTSGVYTTLSTLANSYNALAENSKGYLYAGSFNGQHRKRNNLGTQSREWDSDRKL